MIKHTIITGTSEQIERSKTLAYIVENSNGLSIVNWLGYKNIEDIFNPIHFSITTDTVLVYTNNRPLDYVDFFLFHATNPFFTDHPMEFIFIANHNPFETTTEFSKRFKVLNVEKIDGELNTTQNQTLSIHQLDNKIASLIQMVEDCQKSKNFSKAEKTILCDYYKKMIMETHVKRLDYVDFSTKQIMNQVNTGI